MGTFNMFISTWIRFFKKGHLSSPRPPKNAGWGETKTTSWSNIRVQKMFVSDCFFQKIHRKFEFLESNKNHQKRNEALELEPGKKSFPKHIDHNPKNCWASIRPELFGGCTCSHSFHCLNTTSKDEGLKLQRGFPVFPFWLKKENHQNPSSESIRKMSLGWPKLSFSVCSLFVLKFMKKLW